MNQTVQPTNTIFNYEHWNSQLSALNKKYVNAPPFPHIVIDNFLDENLLNGILNDFLSFNANDWINYAHINEKKRGFNKFQELPPSIKAFISEFNSYKFCKFLSSLTGIENLLPDEKLEGGGLHESRKGGFLNIHADFISHPHRLMWRRRVNILVYLNKDWNEQWGGHLEFWGKDMNQCAQKIAPLFNRCVVFNTDARSYHGHPEPLNCPAEVARRSIALYYFTEEAAPLKVRSTNYQARPQDKSKKWLIELDNSMLNAYTTIKRKLGINDKAISAILRLFSKK